MGDTTNIKGSTVACESHMTSEEQNEDQQNQYNSTLLTTFNQSNDLTKGLKESNFDDLSSSKLELLELSSSKLELSDTKELSKDADSNGINS
jgi:hypothetical protein